MENEEHEKNIPNFYGIPLTFKQRRIHAVLFWFIAVGCVVLDLTRNFGSDYKLNGWLFYPFIIPSYFLIYDTLSWNIDRDMSKFDIWSTLINISVYLMMSFFALVLAGMIFLCILVASLI